MKKRPPCYMVFSPEGRLTFADVRLTRSLERLEAMPVGSYIATQKGWKVWDRVMMHTEDGIDVNDEVA